MPELCGFYGISIRIYFRDHGPPHFHVLYSGHEALMDITFLTVVEGRIPPRARRLVVEWGSLHRDELMAAWGRAQRSEPPGQIAPLE
jgi:hypothetical protein